MQTTVRHEIGLIGTGLHSGRPAKLTIRPSAAEYGIWFRRTDVTDRDNMIAARFDAVSDTQLCTQVENEAGVTVSTIEHLMAALAGCGVHNALIEIDGPEVPILDGSSVPFVHAIVKAGIQELDAPVRVIRVLKRVEARIGQAVAWLEPSDALEIDFSIDFPDAAIGRQSNRLSMANGAFVRELSDCRTFCREADVEAMRAAGLALGGSLDNAIVVSGERVLNPGGLRRDDEPVRHKMLDALGDLALAGAPIQGRYVGKRAGHAVTNKLLRTLFHTPGAFEMVECCEVMVTRLPGVGIKQSDLRAAS